MDKKVMGGKNSTWKMVAVIAAVLLLVAVVYILVNNYKTASANEKNKIFEQGALVGYQAAVEQMMQDASDCKAVDVYANNVTMQLVDVACLSSASSK